VHTKWMVSHPIPPYDIPNIFPQSPSPSIPPTEDCFYVATAKKSISTVESGLPRRFLQVSDPKRQMDIIPKTGFPEQKPDEIDINRFLSLS
jgi:hypothetical protein